MANAASGLASICFAPNESATKFKDGRTRRQSNYNTANAKGGTNGDHSGKMQAPRNPTGQKSPTKVFNKAQNNATFGSKTATATGTVRASMAGATGTQQGCVDC